MENNDPRPVALPTQMGALFIDIAIPAVLSFAAGIASWVGANLVWSALIHGGGIEWMGPEGALALFAPSVFGVTTMGALGPVLLWGIAELWMLGRNGQTLGLRQITADRSPRRIVVHSES